MNRPTSKAAYLEVKESGKEARQADKILAIITRLGSASLQEIMAEYRRDWGNIELSSVSARCNKLKEEQIIRESDVRKCSITNISVNVLSVWPECKHQHFNSDQFEWTTENNRKRIDATVWRGIKVIACPDCGRDVSKYNFVPVKTTQQYLRGLDDE